MAKQQSSTKERDITKTNEPRQYKVIMHNDDVTTVDFVVFVLQNIFFKNHEEAYNLMMKIHTKGSAVVGVYPYDTAVSKSMKTIRLATQHNFPLKVTWQQE